MRAEYSLFIVTAPHAKYYTIICRIGVWLLKSTDQSQSVLFGLLDLCLSCWFEIVLKNSTVRSRYVKLFID